MAIPAVILGAGKALLGGIGRKAAMGAVKSGAKNFVKDRAKNFVTGKGRKKKSNRKVGAKEVTAIVQTGGSSLSVGKGVSDTPGALVPYSSGETKAKTSRSGTATYERLGVRLKNIVSLTETLDNIVKKQYSNTKKSAKRKRTAADKAEDARREGLLEKGGKGLLGFAGNMAKKATGGFDFLNFLTSILLGGLAIGAINLIQKHGLGKGLSVLTDNLKYILYGMRILKGALNSLGAIAWKTTKFAFGIVKKGLGVAVNGAKSLAKTITTGIGRLTKGILSFSGKLLKGAISWAGGIVKYGKNIAKGLRQGKGIKDAVKSANKLRKGKEALGIAKDVAKGTKAARDVSKASKVAKGASKGAKAANAIVPFSRGAKGAKGVLPGAAPFLKRIAKIRGFGAVPFIGPVLTLVAGLLDPEVTVGRAVMRSIGTAIGEMVGNFVGGAIAVGTGGIGAIAVPLLNVTGSLLGEYLGDMMYIGTMGGGWGAVQKKFGEDLQDRVKDALNISKFVGDGLERFYKGMPKYKLSGPIARAIDVAANIPGADKKTLDLLKEGIPDIGWWINPITTFEKVDLFKESFFGKSVMPGREKEVGQTWRDSLNDGSEPWTPPDGSSIGTDEENARHVPETPGMAGVGRQAGGAGNVVAPGVGNIPSSGGMKTATAMYQQLVSDGIPPAAAAGIVGNIGAESNFDPAAIEAATGEGRGLIQWTGPRRTAFENWSRENDLDPDSMEANYGYLMHEMKGGDGNHWMPRRDTPKHLQVRSYEEYIKKATTPELAAELFMLNYERPAVATQHLGRRQNYAKDVAGATPLKAQSKPQTPAVPGASTGESGSSTGEYDIIIPLDHVPGHLSGKFPDNDARTSFKQSRSTGADGRERQAQDPAAAKLKAMLEAKGYKVAIVKPESHSSYEAYDRYIEKQSKKGVRVLPLHFDAGYDPKKGRVVGTGFLTITRSGDAADDAFAAPIQKALEKFQKENPNLGKIGRSRQGNITVNKAAAAPSALVELGIMTWWEKHYGKNFTQSEKFNELIQSVADAIETATPKRGQTPPSSVSGAKGKLPIGKIRALTKALGGDTSIDPQVATMSGGSGGNTGGKSTPQTPAVPGAKGGSGAYASGLKTGPKGRIGSGDEYHIDTKFKASLPMEQKIAMMDQLSRGYAAEGRVIEFSNAAVANMRYSHTMSYEDKVKLLNRAIGAHAHRSGWSSIDYYIPKSGETRFGKSAEGAEILVPSIDGGKLEYHTGGNYGRFVVGVDKDGNVLFKTGHGDSRLSANRGTVSFGRSRRGTTGAAVPTTPAVPQQTTPPKPPTLPPPAVPEQTTPSAPILPPPAVPEARLAPTKPQCDCSGVEKFTDYEVGGSFGAITLPIPITSTAGSGEGMVPKPQGSAGGIGGDVAGMVNSFWKKQLSSFLYKFG